MARMKIEVQAKRAGKYGFSLHDRLVGWLPRYAGYAAKAAPLLNLRNASRLLRRLWEAFGGFSARRDLPRWRRDVFRDPANAAGPAEGREVVLFADTFNRAF